MSLDGGMLLFTHSQHRVQTDSVSLDGGSLSTYALLVVRPAMSLDGGTLSTCTFPESLHGSIQYPVHVLK